MTLSTWLFIPALFAQSVVGLQRPESAAPPARDLVVVVAVPVYLPDGGVTAETVALPTAGAGLVHVFSRKTQCAPASSGASEPADAGFGWRVASQIVARSERDVVVSVDWRRMWDAGKKATNGPSGTVQLTLHAGDRIPLDHIPNTSPPPDCRAVGLGLEVRVARTAPPTSAPAPSSLPLGAMAGGAKPINAELWLTHTSPADTRQVFHQVVRLPEAGGRFTFTPTSVSTSRGDVNVELTGTIDRFRSPAGGEFLVISMNRVISGTNLPAAGLSATTGTVVPMPGAEEVLSFEMAGAGTSGARAGGGGGGGGGRGGAVARSGGGGTATGVAAQGSRGGGGGGGFGGARGAGPNMAQLAALLEGHQFSLRLRVTPAN